MLLLLSIIIWLTVSGANVYQAGSLSCYLVSVIGARSSIKSASWWITGFIWDGVYLGLAWVSVMLPPMMIFFPPSLFGRPRLSSARGIQPGLDVQKNRRAWKTIPDHGHGIRVQRGRCDRNSRDRLAARTIYRHPDE